MYVSLEPRLPNHLNGLGSAGQAVAFGFLGPFALLNCKNRCAFNHMHNREARDECKAACDEAHAARHADDGGDVSVPASSTGSSLMPIGLLAAAAAATYFLFFRKRG